MLNTAMMVCYDDGGGACCMHSVQYKLGGTLGGQALIMSLIIFEFDSNIICIE